MEKSSALITGAAGEIGRAVALALCDLGVQIVLADTDENGLETTNGLVEQTGAKSTTARVDVTDRMSVQTLVDELSHQSIPVTVLVNCAGILRPTPVVNISEDEWDAVVDVNLKGTFLCCQAVIPAMTAFGWGRIVNLSSTAGKNVSTVGGAHYTAAKAGVLGFTRHLASEVARAGITVNAVCPGLIDTSMIRNTITPIEIDRYAESFPIARLGRPDEVASMVRFLTSDEASYVTGAAFDINGGDLMI